MLFHTNKIFKNKFKAILINKCDDTTFVLSHLPLQLVVVSFNTFRGQQSRLVTTGSTQGTVSPMDWNLIYFHYNNNLRIFLSYVCLAPMSLVSCFFSCKVPARIYENIQGHSDQ